MIVATWNVRGLNKGPHQQELINFINSNNISLMSCIETKVKLENSKKISQKINSKWSWVFNYEHHFNGRIWIGWDPSVWTITALSASDQHITCTALFLETQITFITTFVYAHNKPHQRQSLWKDLVSLSSSIHLPWCIAGDFNCMLHLSEVIGGKEHWTPDMQSFKDCLQSSGLGHLNTSGDLYTWTNKRLHAPIYKRLDRFLANKEWFDAFPDSLVLVKHRGIMDHNPLVLSIPMQLQKYRKPFQYFNFLRDIPEFMDTVNSAWNTQVWYGGPMVIFNRKMKDVKRALTLLNKKHGNVHTIVSQARDSISAIQQELSLVLFNPDLLLREKCAVIDL